VLGGEGRGKKLMDMSSELTEFEREWVFEGVLKK